MLKYYWDYLLKTKKKWKIPLLFILQIINEYWFNDLRILKKKF